MTDIVDKKTRSRMMAGIHSKDTKPEMLIRRALHGMGFRYHLHDKKLPGKPDLLLPRYNAVIQIHGCFWHAHNCPLFKLPKTRTEFWREKITGNQTRDKKNIEKLISQGWRVLIWWECNTRKPKEFENAVEEVAKWLRSDEIYLEIE